MGKYLTKTAFLVLLLHLLISSSCGPPRICASFCDRVFEACSDAYFSSDASKKVIVPCGDEDIICGKASKWESNGTAFCDAMGFTVQREEPCYGSKASLEPVMEPGSSEETTPKLVVWFQDLKQPVREMITWTVIVTACFLYRGFIDINDLGAVRLRADRNGNA